MIHIHFKAGEQPLESHITHKALKRIFPKIDNYYVRDEVARKYFLPEGKLTRTGVRLAIDWFGPDVVDANGFETVKPQELLAVYQAMAFLGQKEDAEVMKVLAHNFKIQLENAALSDAMRIWQFHGVNHTKLFIDLLLEKLEAWVKAAYHESTAHKKLDALSDWLYSDDDLLKVIEDRKLQWLMMAAINIGKRNYVCRAKHSAIGGWGPNLDTIEEVAEPVDANEASRIAT
jgi:hypothetical protein